MSKPANVIVLGNCQSHPVSSFLWEMCGGDSKFTPLIAHLSSPDQEKDDIALLNSADLILTQPISDNYKASHLATSRLKALYPDLVCTWPNLYFSGQTPDIIALKDCNGSMVTGPLDVYHSAGVTRCWQNDLSVKQTTDYLERELPITETELKSCIEQSMQTLVNREQSLDIKITDFIEEKLQCERLFFTYNHPSSRLIIEVCERISTFCQFPVKKTLISGFWNEPLGRFIGPTSRPLAEMLGLSFPYTNACKGVELKIVNDELVLGASKIYSFEEFVQSSFDALNLQLRSDHPVSSAPPLSGMGLVA